MNPYCSALFFGTEVPDTVDLPNLRNLSSSECQSLLTGGYRLSNEYNLKLTKDSEVYSLCVVKKHFTHVSACVEIGTTEQLQRHVICNPDMRPDCLPSAIVRHWFGLSLWYQEKFMVDYTVVDIDSSEISSLNLTNTTHSLSSVWLKALDCQDKKNWAIATIVLGVLLCFCLAVTVGCCFWIHYKRKKWGHRVPFCLWAVIAVSPIWNWSDLVYVAESTTTSDSAPYLLLIVWLSNKVAVSFCDILVSFIFFLCLCWFSYLFTSIVNHRPLISQEATLHEGGRSIFEKEHSSSSESLPLLPRLMHGNLVELDGHNIYVHEHDISATRSF